MKYTFTGQPLSKDERARINKSIFYNIDDTAPDFIFNNFTGLGGLHGINFKDYSNYHDYTEAKKVLELGQFFTPPELCEQIVSSLQPSKTDKVADFTCGSGNFFNYFNEKNCYGCEIETVAYKVARKLYPSAEILQGDFSEVTFSTTFDLVLGNPPFNIRTDSGKLSQYAYMQLAARYLKPGKMLALIVPKTFLADEYGNKHKWEELAESFDFVCQAEIPTNYFDVELDIKVMYWRRRGVSNSGKIYCNNYVPFDADAIYNNFIRPIHEDNFKNAAALHLYTIRTATKDSNTEKITKYLYHIKAQRVLRERYYQKALDKLHLLKTQVKPEKMKSDEWERTKLTTEEVANWMKEKISTQYAPAPKQVVKLVKTNYGFKSKAYSKALKPQESSQSIISLVLKKKKFVNNYDKLLQRKIAEYTIQNTPFSKMKRNKQIDKFLKKFSLSEKYTAGGGLNLFGKCDEIKLNDKQFKDLGLAFQKKYSILNWQQGGGKSVAGMAWIDYVRHNVKHVFIAAPSLAVQLTWSVRLQKYGYDFILIDGYDKFAQVKPGQIILMSFDMVRILKYHLKRFVKRLCGNLALLVDESDELTNFASSRTRAMLTCFRKAKYKILTTGTTTRNSINEVYPQLELLYNNSINLLCWTKRIWKEDKDKVLQEQDNPNYGEPFPPFTGHNLFKYSFCPQRTTVFGVKADTQDIYNAEQLKEILAKTIITRTFDDIVGKRIYQIKNHQVLQNAEEKRLYGIIINKFYEIVYNYYQNTGNSRKEQLLRLIRQITLLIQSTSIPHTFEDYEDRRILPAKFYKIRDLVKKWDEKVAIGVVMIEAAKEYHAFLTKQFPNRRIFYIDGLKSFPARKKIIAAFQATQNGILISTQQSLKSSIDIETCDKCILESLQWNLPKMSQYFFRFIRYNSKKSKEIHFVTYADSIEQNILALLMTKERLNEFVKEGKEVSRADMFADYGIDTSILDQIITKEYDSEGNLNLRWGKQTIAA
jgi:SAM-dependent methyltransferase